MPFDLNRARDALHAIDPGCDRDNWIRIGMACKSAGLEFEDFDRWSSSAGNYNERDCKSAWRSFNASGATTESTLYREAIDAGWTDPARLNGHAGPHQRAQATRKPAGEAKGPPFDFNAVWAAAEPAGIDLPYIERKLGLPGGLRVYRGNLSIAKTPIDGALLVLAFDADGTLVTWQANLPTGRKLNAPGHPVSGWFTLPGNGDTTFICEGIGAAWSTHQATSSTAVCSFGLGNLAKVATALKQPGKRIVLVADVGVESKVERIAREIGCEWIAPPADLGDKSDINDLHKRDGMRAVTDLLAKARAPEPADETAEPVADEQPLRFKFLTLAEYMRQPASCWRILRVIPGRGLVVVWGASGSGKTFAVLDMAAAVCRALPWAGRRTKAGTVAYVATEGNLSERIAAYLQHNNLSAIDGLRVLDSSVNLLDPQADVHDLILALRRLVDGSGGIAMVVIDTLNRAMPGGDENSSEDMGRVIAHAKTIEREIGCAVVFVHHSGKDESKGSRGHSSLKAATDAEISVRRDGDIRTVTAEKVRDGEDGEILMTFRLDVVDLGPMVDVDPDAGADERRTSCVVAPTDAPLDRAGTTRLSDTDQIALRVLKDACADSTDRTEVTSIHPGGLPRVSVDAWRDRFRQVRGVDKADAKALDASRKAFQRAIDKLVERRIAGVYEARAWLW